MSLRKLKEIRSILWIVLILCIVCLLMLELFLTKESQIQDLEQVNDQVEDVLLLNDEDTGKQSIDQGKASSDAKKETNNSPSKVNINQATVEQLMTLPNIGEVKAQAIVDYREENGRFLNGAELTNVKGIGEKTVEKLKGLITY
ncbi:ComEA family DNA-binding protein [Chengkuizengella axinellae]|uniref:ComEA family DNA-binding protein n=1 Tax=Chengkuizengella axinellae TaxID=3064388 RepID=A0ABT9IW79_9BACL|nr:ComEA family DNA-binding protein [Chengkuizengella sp. 2205SS18-9]MDP5273045.1 ComEA family DNA-binding protein [Chengkuizengella sp. 2205SS18-9]